MTETREMVTVIIGKPAHQILRFYFGTPAEAVAFSDQVKALKSVDVVNVHMVRNDQVDTAVAAVRDAAGRYNGVYG